MARVTLEDVSCVFGEEVTAVSHLSLQVEDRGFLVLVGPSGCGKSTTLRMIAGLEEVSSGTIRIGEGVVNDIPPKDRNIAMVFQNYALYPHMTVYENLAFSLEMRYGGDWWSQWFWNWWQRFVMRPSEAAELAAQREGIPDRVKATAKTLGIEALLDRLPSQLSGGEKQRVALGRAIVRQPAAFLFDEPLSNLDARLRVEMRRELKQLHRRLGATMIYVTHDQVEALTLGDRIAVLDRGVLQQVGTPQEVYERPANRFVAGFVGSPPMNFLEGRWTSEGIDLKVGEIRTERARDKKEEVVVGIRAEDVRVTQDDAETGLEPAEVMEVESLGDSSLVHVTWGKKPGEEAGATQMVAKVEGREAPAIGQRVSVSLNASRLHLFDAASGERLAEG